MDGCWVEKKGLRSLADAIVLVELAAEQDSAPALTCSALTRAAVLAAVTSVEATANAFLLDALPAIWKEGERLRTLSKVELAAAFHGKELDRGRAQFQRIKELIGLRNQLVHPKNKGFPIVRSAQGFEKHEPEVSQYLKIPKLSTWWTSEHAVAAIKSVADFYSYCFVDVFGFDLHRVAAFLCDQLEGESGVYYIAEYEQNALFRAHRDHGVGLSFLGLDPSSGK